MAESRIVVEPWDTHNKNLVANVHPSGWKNPEPASRYNLVVLGAGTAGLVSAMGAAGLGARVAIVEKHLMGGDCLNVGCVPSKALIRSSRAITDVRDAASLGIRVPSGVEADFAAVMERLRRLRADISHHDSAQRCKENGVDVFLGEGRFTGRDALVVDGKTLRFKKAVIATGARAAEPPIRGLKDAGYLTNESVFGLTTLPRRLAVIGGGPIGCELAQAFHRLGSEVTLLHKNRHILDREDAEAANILQKKLTSEGVRIAVNATISEVRKEADGKHVHFSADGQDQAIVVDEILVGAGRAPNVEGLNLEAAGVGHDMRRGVHINDFLQTTNPDIYAAGDICLRTQFTHTADASARIVLQNAFFFGRKRLSALTVPWCTFTDPEVAHVGAYEDGERQETFVRHLKDVDRAITDGETEGFVKVHVRKGSDEILGATIVARHAGEMISELSLAIVAGVGLGKISSVIHPYPTQAEAIRQVADSYNKTRLTPRVKKILSALLSWRRT